MGSSGVAEFAGRYRVAIVVFAGVILANLFLDHPIVSVGISFGIAERHEEVQSDPVDSVARSAAVAEKGNRSN